MCDLTSTNGFAGATIRYLHTRSSTVWSPSLVGVGVRYTGLANTLVRREILFAHLLASSHQLRGET